MASTDKMTTSDILFNHLFEACNILRGPINQDEYKSYVTPLLFFKRLSDVYDEECEQILEDYDGDEEALLFPENHRFIIPEGCHWKDVREKVENIGAAIANAMTKIERANPNTLYGVFSSFDEANWTDKNKLTDARLKDLIEHFSKIKVGNNDYSADVMGDAYEYLIKKFADMSKKNAGEFYTPRAVVKLLVKILNPKPGDTVYDPACGTGGMLIEAIRYVNDNKKTYGKIYGQENNLSTSAIARMNLFLHGAEDFKIIKGDTLRNPGFVSMGELARFDCVIANPPFSLENWGASAFEHDAYGRNIWGTPPDSNGDFAWIQHMISSMAEKSGRCAVVLPQGVLFKSGKIHDMRQKMIESDKLECVIILGKNLFYSTQLQPCILFFNNNKSEERKGKIQLIDASNIVTVKRAQNILSPENVDEIFSIYSNAIDDKKISSIVQVNELDDFDLSVNKYMKQEKEVVASFDEVLSASISNMETIMQLESDVRTLLKEGGYINE